MPEVILFYNGLEVPTRQILDSKCAIPSKTTADAKAQLNSLGREIKKVNEKERGFGSLPSSTEANSRYHVKSISTTVEADTNPIRVMGSSQYAVSTSQNTKLIYETRQTTILFPSHLNDYYCEEKKGLYGPKFLEANSYEASHINNSIPQKEKDPRSFTLPCYINNVYFDNTLADFGASISVMPLSTYLNLGLGIGKFVFPIDFIILDILEDVKVPLILERPFLSTAHAKIDVFKRKITLRVGDEKFIFKSVKLASRETLVLNKSLDLIWRLIELNDINVPLELRRDQVDDLMPTIEEGEVINEPMIDIIKTRKNESFDEEFYNSIMKDKVEYTGKNIVGAFMKVPIFVENFSVVTHFAVVENMDGYRDQDMGDIILGKPFCKASCVEAKRFNGLITIHNGNDNMTYQMARSHPRFKHLSNAQCNKIKPLLKVSMHDKLNRISHPYQKLKSFYNGVLNLGPEYVRDAKMEEWLTRGHVSVHEMV
ncbi:retrovirus-related pol polyprotein from transposon TNT 1-94 [Tanacetum coccineum]